MTEQENTMEVPKQEEDNTRTNVMYAIVLEEGLIYRDQRDCFPVANKNRSDGELLRSYDKMYKYLQDKRYKPVTHWLDNEAPGGIKQYNMQNTTKYPVCIEEMQQREPFRH
eukprot:12168069-Ditylum_brightwellii.AAC.1